MDIPTCSSVNDVQIWSVKESGRNDFKVIYSVVQTITEWEQASVLTSSYEMLCMWILKIIW